jgi:hypothetical protein
MDSKYTESQALEIYKAILNQIIVPLTGDDTTYLSELNGIGHKLLGVKFSGVYPSDKIPRLNDLKKYAILNLDTSKEPGSHWIAIAKKNNITYVYDSFGRSHTKIIKNLQYSGNGRIVNTELDSEQNILETNCGARSLAWLVLFDKWGSDVAMLI